MNLRHLLDMVPNSTPTNGRKAQSSYANNQANFDTNMVIILAALLCALICALGLNSIVRCALRCTGRVSTVPAHERDGHLGPSSRGIKKSKLRKIPIFVYGLGTNDAIHSTDCPICIGEFEYGEKVRVLPKCHHGFHVKCIDIWLASHTSCPTCRQSLIELPEATDAEDMEAGFRQPSHGLTGLSIGESNASGAAEDVG